MDKDTPELEDHKIPWKIGNSQGYRLVCLSVNFNALTVYKHNTRLVLTNWSWENHYGRDWSQGEGAWKMGSSFVLERSDFQTLVLIAKDLEQ